MSRKTLFVSSSFLDVEPSSLKIEPAIGFTAKQKTRVEVLDAFFDKHVRKNQKAFVKLDVQGYEMEVLNGASKALDNVIGLQLEMSIVPIYKNECLMHEMGGILKKKNFILFDLQEVFNDGKTGQLLQVDGLFLRDSQVQ